MGSKWGYSLLLAYNPIKRRNWATYVAYEEGKTVTLFAGQTHPAGTVHFSDIVGGIVTITITLSGDWEFADIEENVKIQDYAIPPFGNPKVGHFDYKDYATESPFSIGVPANNYYGVNVDVGYWLEIECPE